MIKGSSIFIRQYMLPNPFGDLPNADILNWMAGIILYPVTYIVVSLFYRERSNPPLGAFLYLFFYAVHTGLIALCGVFDFSKVSIIIIGILYVLVLGGIKTLQRKAEWGYY